MKRQFETLTSQLKVAEDQLGQAKRIPPVRAALRDEGLRAENSAYGQS